MSLVVAVDADVRRHVPHFVRRELQRRLQRAASALGLRDREITVRIMASKTMQALHETHLGERKSTDVLSFEPGDIAICWDVVSAQAPGAEPSELAQLGVHALAHLAGHDHDERPAARAMLRVERRACRRAGLPGPTRPYGAAA